MELMLKLLRLAFDLVQYQRKALISTLRFSAPFSFRQVTASNSVFLLLRSASGGTVIPTRDRR